MKMKTANPALGENTFTGFSRVASADEAMSLQGTVNKSLVLLLLVILAAGYVWNIFFQTGNPAAVGPWVMVGAIGGFIVALVTIFKQDWAMVTAPLYAILEGLFLGGFSALAESQYPGIVMQGVGLTFGTCLMLLLAYKTGWVKATENFKLGVVAATGGIALVYLITIILGFFQVNVPVINDNSLMGIGFSLFVVVIAALNLVLDFDFIETGVVQRAPKYMEWYAAFGLMVTLIWLYLEIIRLLMKLRSRD
jgi:uncharacterized YccA/Bax inhibitor family protein